RSRLLSHGHLRGITMRKTLSGRQTWSGSFWRVLVAAGCGAACWAFTAGIGVGQTSSTDQSTSRDESSQSTTSQGSSSRTSQSGQNQSTDESRSSDRSSSGQNSNQNRGSTSNQSGSNTY